MNSSNLFLGEKITGFRGNHHQVASHYFHRKHNQAAVLTATGCQELTGGQNTIKCSWKKKIKGYCQVTVVFLYVSTLGTGQLGTCLSPDPTQTCIKAEGTEQMVLEQKLQLLAFSASVTKNSNQRRAILSKFLAVFYKLELLSVLFLMYLEQEWSRRCARQQADVLLGFIRRAKQV